MKPPRSDERNVRPLLTLPEVLRRLQVGLAALPPPPPGPPNKVPALVLDPRVELALRRGCPPARDLLRGALKARPTDALQVVERALQWFEQQRYGPLGRGGIVVLSGVGGSGKSVALAWAMTKFPEGQGGARYVKAAELAAMNTKDWGAFLEARQALVDVSVLAIDEAAAEYARFAGSRLAALLHERYDAGRLTLVATNVERAEFAARYFSFVADGEPDGRFVSRLEHEQPKAGLDAFWELPGIDYRAEPGKLP